MGTHKILPLAVVLGAFINCSDSANRDLINLDMSTNTLQHIGKLSFFEDTPASGLVNEYYSSGALHRISRYEDGMLQGITRSWYPGGSKESERYYHRGEKEGLHIGWWPNGSKQFEYQFSDGSYHGTFKEWYESGKLLHVFEYDHGQEVSAIGWRENGRTYINFTVRNGRKYGLTNARLCFSLKDEAGIYQ